MCCSVVCYYYIRENTLPYLLLWGGCPEKLGLGELGGLAGWRVEQQSREIFLKVGRRIQCPEKLGLGELGGLAGWRVEQQIKISFLRQVGGFECATRGVFSKTGPHQQWTGVECRWGLVFFSLLFCVCVLEKKNQVSTIFLYRKINNKKVTDNDLIDWRAYGVETLTKPKQTKLKRKHKQNVDIRLYSCYHLL